MYKISFYCASVSCVEMKVRYWKRVYIEYFKSFCQLSPQILYSNSFQKKIPPVHLHQKLNITISTFLKDIFCVRLKKYSLALFITLLEFCLESQTTFLKQNIYITSAPIGAFETSRPFQEVMTDRSTDQPTDRWTGRFIGKFHFQ